jgi:hypothetical protein
VRCSNAKTSHQRDCSYQLEASANGLQKSEFYARKILAGAAAKKFWLTRHNRAVGISRSGNTNLVDWDWQREQIQGAGTILLQNRASYMD